MTKAHYDYKKISKCGCIICKRCRSRVARKPKTEQDIKISKQYKFIRILYSEISYMLRDFPKEVGLVWDKLVIENVWNDGWPDMTLEAIYLSMKEPRY
jgi:hypothetical protein